MHPDVKSQAFVVEHITLPQLDTLAVQLLKFMGSVRVCCVIGEMGAGKTTVIKALGRELQVLDTMSSPTFSIVNEYITKAKESVYHFDFYRIKSEREAYDIGAEEYFYSGNYCFIEWPEKIPTVLPDVYAQLKIGVESNTQRTLELKIHGRKEEKWV